MLRMASDSAALKEKKVISKKENLIVFGVCFRLVWLDWGWLAMLLSRTWKEKGGYICTSVHLSVNKIYHTRYIFVSNKIYHTLSIICNFVFCLQQFTILEIPSAKDQLYYVHCGYAPRAEHSKRWTNQCARPQNECHRGSFRQNLALGCLDSNNGCCCVFLCYIMSAKGALSDSIWLLGALTHTMVVVVCICTTDWIKEDQFQWLLLCGHWII